MKNLIVAIDGFSACGKSTLAKALAKVLHLSYIDTGAMYRAVTLYFLNNKVSFHNEDEIKNALENIEIHFENINGDNHCFLNNVDVEVEIRSQAVSEYVSEVATISSVRREMVALQRKMGDRRVVMDGRDIGTVVFPNAHYKFFLTASATIRAERRMLEYREKGIDVDIRQVIDNIAKRDHIDSTREDSPLMVADDAIIIDNSFLTKEEQLELILTIVNNKIL